MRPIIILGLTGSIGMGKSETARMFRRLGVPVFDADATVHRLFAKGGAAVHAVAKAFPGVLKDGAIDRKALGAQVFGHPAKLRQLEAIVHPLVRDAEKTFLRRAVTHRHKLAVLDIPLLFETGGRDRCDYIAVVSAPAFIQRQRVLARPGMTEDRLEAVLAQQIPDRDKRRHADFIIHSGLGKAYAFAQVRRIVAFILKRHQNMR
jgi:dephospho-CoA kinase